MWAQTGCWDSDVGECDAGETRGLYMCKMKLSNIGRLYRRFTMDYWQLRQITAGLEKSKSSCIKQLLHVTIVL